MKNLADPLNKKVNKNREPSHSSRNSTEKYNFSSPSNYVGYHTITDIM